MKNKVFQHTKKSKISGVPKTQSVFQNAKNRRFFSMKKILIIGLILLIFGVLLFVDQFRLHGRLYEYHDIDNHETIALMFLSASIPLLILGLLRNRKIKTKTS